MNLDSDWKNIEFNKIIELYNSVGWQAYTEDKDSLLKAFENSDYVLLAYSDDKQLAGLSRSVSDDVSIHYLQDILVAPDYQKKGVGRKLLNKALERFGHVRAHMILTDDEEKQLKFYESLGYKNTKELKKYPLNTFVKMKDLDLE